MHKIEKKQRSRTKGYQYLLKNRSIKFYTKCVNLLFKKLKKVVYQLKLSIIQNKMIMLYDS